VALSSASWSALFHGRYLIYTLLLTLSIGVHALGMHMLATVLPSIVADLGGATFYAWATLLYTIASIIGTVCGGLVTARLDLRRGYLVGALVFLGGLGRLCYGAAHSGTAARPHAPGAREWLARRYSVTFPFYDLSLYSCDIPFSTP
jgi:MFS family permease